MSGLQPRSLSEVLGTEEEMKRGGSLRGNLPVQQHWEAQLVPQGGVQEADSCMAH